MNDLFDGKLVDPTPQMMWYEGKFVIIAGIRVYFQGMLQSMVELFIHLNRQ
jgi:hypothetical protein